MTVKTNTEAMRRLGISLEDCRALRRISMTLQRWNEADANGDIIRETDDGPPFRRFEHKRQDGSWKVSKYRIPDRERGAQRRLAAIMTRYPDLLAYEQTDCRGCGLYLVRRELVPPGEDIGSYYSRGVAVW